MTILTYLAAGFVLVLIGIGLLGWALVAGGALGRRSERWPETQDDFTPSMNRSGAAK